MAWHWEYSGMLAMRWYRQREMINDRRNKIGK